MMTWNLAFAALPVSSAPRVGLPGARSLESPAPSPEFLLEGHNDVYDALPPPPPPGRGDGPLYPSLSSRLRPALDVLEQTVQALGKHPAAEAVDRSNVRRLIRAILPLVQAHRGCFPRKRGDRAVEALRDVASAIGHYKDVAVIASTVASLPEGHRAAPRALHKALEREDERRRDDFEHAWRQFRKHDLEEVVETLGHPRSADLGSPGSIERTDRRFLADAVHEALDRVERDGLLDPTAPRESHESRKALRRVLHAMKACGEDLGARPEDVQALTELVGGLGRAQDLYITQEWLTRKGFTPEARIVTAQVEAALQQQAARARELEGDGFLDRLREAVRAFA